MMSEVKLQFQTFEDGLAIKRHIQERVREIDLALAERPRASERYKLVSEKVDLDKQAADIKRQLALRFPQAVCPNCFRPMNFRKP